MITAGVSSRASTKNIIRHLKTASEGGPVIVVLGRASRHLPTPILLAACNTGPGPIIPIAECAASSAHHLRGFVPWRLSDADRRWMSHGSRWPASKLHVVERWKIIDVGDPAAGRIHSGGNARRRTA
jgi:hypothetical protein